MLEEVTRAAGDRPLGRSFSFLLVRRASEAGGAATMTMNFTGAEQSTADFLTEIDALYREAAAQLFGALKSVKKGNVEDAKVAAAAMRDLKQAIDWALSERNHVEKVRKQGAGAVGATELDFAGARDEIGRRLAVLRDAGSD
jgi:hypothetical protein